MIVLWKLIIICSHGHGTIIFSNVSCYQTYTKSSLIHQRAVKTFFNHLTDQLTANNTKKQTALFPILNHITIIFGNTSRWQNNLCCHSIPSKLISYTSHYGILFLLRFICEGWKHAISQQQRSTNRASPAIRT